MLNQQYPLKKDPSKFYRVDDLVRNCNIKMVVYTRVDPYTDENGKEVNISGTQHWMPLKDFLEIVDIPLSEQEM